MSDLSQLSPHYLWRMFAQICAIPHPSYHEQALSKYIIEWAEEHKIQAERDSVGNILLRKPATVGMETRQTVVLQAHLDMVPQKNSDTEHDFTRDPIQAYIDGEWIKAKGTTLGADNGIGMASALAVLIDPDVVHGPLEVLLTINEESGMDGAFGLQPGWLTGSILINTDSEKEGEIYMGCAGGLNVSAKLPLQRETLPAGYQTYQLTLKGLQGGHSGCDIHLGLGNANKLMARFLVSHADGLALKLLNLSGGTLRNAIPREAFAIFALPAHNVTHLSELITEYQATLQHELGHVEKKLRLELTPTTSDADPLQTESQQKLLALINASPNGVIRMSDEIPGVVETSLNLGVVKMESQQAEVVYLVRSQLESSKRNVFEMLRSVGDLAGASVEANRDYPGWKPNTQSPIMKLTRETYQHLFDTTPEIMVIHAGLECGIFKKSYPNMDMVSIGPTIVGPHSPDERVHIGSVGKYWQLLTAVLKAIPQQA